MIRMYPVVYTLKIDASFYNWCWIEWLIHQREFTLDGLVEMESSP